MQGLGEIQRRPHDNFEPTRNVTTHPGPFPNLATRNVIRDVCAEIIESTAFGEWTKEQKDAFAFGFVRGALDVMKRDNNPATAGFAAALLVQVNKGGIDAVHKIVLDVTGNDFRG